SLLDVPLSAEYFELEAILVTVSLPGAEVALKAKPFKVVEAEGRLPGFAKTEHAILVAHKIALDPNLAQRQYFAPAAGTARFTFWALAEWQRQYQAGEKPNDRALRRQLSAIKRAQFPWMFDVTKCAAQEAMIDISAVLSQGNRVKDTMRRPGLR